MCFSAEASFVASAVLIPAGVLATVRAAKVDARYTAISALPVLLGLQQLSEGFVWLAGDGGNQATIETLSLIYMFFSWIAWPVWIPLSVYFIEPPRRRTIFIPFLIVGSMLGALQYIPYFVHQGWLQTQFLSSAISYRDVELLDDLMSRSSTYSLYLAIIIAPLLIASDRNIKIFGLLVAAVVLVTYLFFQYAYISVFCFGGALVSAWLVYVAYRKLPANAATSGAIT